MLWAHCGPGFWNGVFGRSKVSQRAPSLDPMAMLSSSYGYLHPSVHACSCARVLVCMYSVCTVYVQCMYSVCRVCARVGVYVECMYSVCRVYVQVYSQCMYSVCTVYVQSMYSVCTVYVQCMYSVCTVYSQCMYSACTVYVEGIQVPSYCDFLQYRFVSSLCCLSSGPFRTHTFTSTRIEQILRCCQLSDMSLRQAQLDQQSASASAAAATAVAAAAREDDGDI